MEQWVNFIKSYFPSEEEARNFVTRCEDLPEQKQNAKLILHQTQRLVTIADDIYKIRPGRDSLRLLFLLICAEAVAKLYKNYTREGKSLYYTKLFFEELCDISELNGSIVNSLRSIVNNSKGDLSPLEVIELLYKIRCSVVHEGRYWEFFFNKDGIRSTASQDYKNGKLFYVTITYEKLRDIIIKGAINAIAKLMQI